MLKYLSIAGLAAFILMSSAKANQLEEISKLTPAEVDAYMKATAESASRSLPAKVDSITTINSAVYFKDQRTLTYFGTLIIDVDAHELQKLSKENFCHSEMNKAWAAKGVIYRYIHVMPSKKSDISFNFNSCR